MFNASYINADSEHNIESPIVNTNFISREMKDTSDKAKMIFSNIYGDITNFVHISDFVEKVEGLYENTDMIQYDIGSIVTEFIKIFKADAAIDLLKYMHSFAAARSVYAINDAESAVDEVLNDTYSEGYQYNSDESVFEGYDDHYETFEEDIVDTEAEPEETESDITDDILPADVWSKIP